MPPDPKRLGVLKAMKAVAQGITGAAYHFPVTNPKSVTLDPTFNLMVAPGIDLPLYVIEPDPDSTRDFYPAMQVRDVMTGTITGRKDVADVVDPDARANAWEKMAADLEKAFAVDVTLGGLVYDLRLKTPAPFVGVGTDVVMVVVPWEARMHRTYGEP
jgi:hypothetical protein